MWLWDKGHSTKHPLPILKLTGAPPQGSFTSPSLATPGDPTLLNPGSLQNLQHIKWYGSRMGTLFLLCLTGVELPLTQPNLTLFIPDNLYWPHSDNSLRPYPTAKFSEHPAGGS